MKSAALELGQYGITVNAVIPGLVHTPLTRHRQRYAQAIDDLSNSEPLEQLEEEAKRKLIVKSPLGLAWLLPESIAPAVVFLASDDASMVLALHTT
ncbi:SDR family oxidoreductase [Mesorhizobium sp. B4-1-3]|uniref:SDR family oxidoreductase n=1 Tax=Mesorhizobium sp. B4-1-3 TaxID=2589889 RepID=UPI001AED7CD7|nr:SDR family oxidoreductase [Mesorhizobium sp. B4-1-3]